ncbi:MAG: type II secretion system protein N [Pseudomonadota bacterium]
MKYLFVILNILLVGTIIYLGSDYYKKKMIDEPFLLPALQDNTLVDKAKTHLPEPSFSKKYVDIIVQRNLFDVQIKEEQVIEKEEPALETLEKTSLKLALWGTVTGTDDVYAVIEDKKERMQSLYQIGDTVQDAKIKKILRNQVILSFQGKDQMLEMESDLKTSSGSGPREKTVEAVQETENNTRVVNISAPKKEEDSQDELSRQIKFRPHYVKGIVDGMMIYGIRPNAVFHEIGLRNGDIIKEINGSQIVEQANIADFFEQIDTLETAVMILFRRGKTLELSYTIKDGQYLVNMVDMDLNKGDQE